MHKWLSSKTIFKIYIKIAPTCFGAVIPFSGSSLSVPAKVTLFKNNLFWFIGVWLSQWWCGCLRSSLKYSGHFHFHELCSWREMIAILNVKAVGKRFRLVLPALWLVFAKSCASLHFSCSPPPDNATPCFVPTIWTFTALLPIASTYLFLCLSPPSYFVPYRTWRARSCKKPSPFY